MKPYAHIKKAKQIVNDLKFDYNQNPSKAKGQRINDLIDVVESFESMLEERYYTESIETLIYTIIYEYLLMFNVATGEEIPLHTIVKNIDTALMNGSKQKKLEVISLLKDHEMINKLSNKTVFDKKYTNFDKLLTNLMNQFKAQIKWKQKDN